MSGTKIPLAREFTGTAVGAAIQENAGAAAKAVNAMPFGSGNLVEGIVFAGLPITINHKLNRVPRGYVFMRANAPPLYETVPAANDRTITMTGGTVGTFSIWFF